MPANQMQKSQAMKTPNERRRKITKKTQAKMKKMAESLNKAMKAMKAMKKDPAPAWISGGSSSKPRQGKVLRKPAAARKGTQQASKHGFKLLQSRDRRSGARKATPYTPKHQQPKGPKFQLRTSTSKATMNLEKLTKMSEKQLVAYAWANGHLDKHQACNHCGAKSLGPLKLKPGGKTYARRCGSKRCRKWVFPHAAHPILSVGSGISYMPLRTQMAILFCAAWGFPQKFVPAMIDGLDSPKGVERIYKSWRSLLAIYVKAKQSNIRYGTRPSEAASSSHKQPMDEIEADEAVFRKKDLPDNEVQWQEYTGTKRRGDRSSLVLDERSAKASRSSRADLNGRAVPPPMSKSEWIDIRDKRCGDNTLMHTDGAPAYREQRPGTRHDSVRHSYKGKQRPEYTKVTTHCDLNGNEFKAVAGTQSLDGWWAHGKRACHGVQAQCEDKVADHIREAQWQHWTGDGDRWLEAGRVISWTP